MIHKDLQGAEYIDRINAGVMFPTVYFAMGAAAWILPAYRFV